MKLGVSFYYVGDIAAATERYAQLLGTAPVVAEADWVRFELDGGALALHADASLPRTSAAEPMKYGAVVSLSVEDMPAFLGRARECEFTLVGAVQELPYGLQAELRDPWGNRLSILQPKAA